MKDKYTSAHILVSTKGMTRDTWLEHRKEGIGGSDIAAICGFSKPYATAIGVWLDKLGKAEPTDTNEAMEWGNRLEAPVAEKFAELHPEYKVIRRNAILQHPTLPYCLGNVDRLLKDNDGRYGILEIKTTGAHREGAWSDDSVPMGYQVQVQWYLFVTGLSYAFIAVLIGGQKYREMRIERDDELITMLAAEAHDFWQDVQTGTMPPADGSDACSAELKTLYPVAVPGRHIELPPTLDECLGRYKLACEDAKEAEQAKKDIENQVKQAMGETEKAQSHDGRWRIAWTMFERKGYTVQATTGRKLTITEEK